ncbi:MAG: amino acid ABC transporter substrate-binding protein [Methylobacteriaceae bacterium]|nr:amino acid ABC transporter substrate-binding protein [Methylobacteriaceae bacterium]
MDTRMRPSALGFVAVFAALSAFAVPATAQDLTGTLKKVKDTGSISLGHRESSLPFSYYDDNQKVVGYAYELCDKLADAVQAELKMDKLERKLVAVTSANRIPLLTSGGIDLECGSTTNNLERQKEVSFTLTHYVTATRFVSKKANNYKSLDDLKGKTIVSTAGTSNIKLVTGLNTERNLGMTIIPAKDHADAFLMVETDRAAAFAMDDILIASLVAVSKTPDAYVISEEALSVEPYGSMLRKDDPAFKKVIDDAMLAMFKDGTIEKLYDKWFMNPIPPKNVTLNVPISAQFKKVIANPTDSGDPKDYAD